MHKGLASVAERPVLSARLWGLPGPVWTMMLIWAVGLALVVYGMFFPVHEDQNVTTKIVGLGVGLTVLLALLFLRCRTPTWLIWGALFLYIALDAVLINTAPGDAGAVSLMLGMLAAAVYGGVWGQRRTAIAVLAAIVIAGTFAIITVDRSAPALDSAWIMVCFFAIVLVAVLQVLVAALEQQALIDPLTGVLNRRGLHSLTHLRQTSGRRRGIRTVALIDVDDFKGINDDLGHAEGDRVLRELAEHWVGGLRSDDIVVRLGGDEFVLVLNRADEDAAVQLLERLRSGSVAPWSYGLAAWPEGAAFDESLAKADAALLEKKRARGLSKR